MTNEKKQKRTFTEVTNEVTKKVTQQTAVEWFKKQLEDYGSYSHLSLDWDTLDELCQQAKEIEKEQIISAFVNGHKDGWRFAKHEKQQFIHSEQYYNETYGGN